MSTVTQDEKEVEATAAPISNRHPQPSSNGINAEDVVDIPVTENDAPDEEEKKGNAGAAYLRVWKYSTPLDHALRLCAMFAAFGAGAALPLMTIVFGNLVNNFNNFGSNQAAASELLDQVSHGGLLLTYLFIGKFVLVYIHTVCFTITANRTTSALRQAYIRALLQQDIAYYDTASSGSVVTSITNNADMVQNGLGEKVGIALQSGAMLVSAYIVAFTRQWKLSLVTSTTMPGAVLGVAITVILDAKVEARILEIYSKAGGLVEEALSSIRIVTAFGAGNKMRRKYDAYLDSAKRDGIKKGPILGTQYSSEFFISYCAYALAFWYGIKLLLDGEVDSAGTIITVVFSVLIATSALTMIAPSITEFSKSAAAAVKIFEVIDKEIHIDPLSTEGKTPDPGPGQLSLSDVSFSYPARKSVNVLDSVTLDFEAGKTTAIVGASGSGKSTIVALLERWYDPVDGEILFDGLDVKDLNVRWLRSQIGYVQQEPILFNDTVYANVAHGLYSSSMDTLPEDEKRKLVQAACVEANADSFIQELPQGYDTNVGERGGLVSGGQKQRIAIARSIVSNPRILLLDEATSALDPKAEELVQAALDKVSKTRTTVMIAHKLSTVKKADTIVVLSQGKLVEQGDHASLIEKDGAYAALVRAQNLSAKDADEPAGAGNTMEKEDSLDEGELHKAVTETKFAETLDESEDVSRKLSLASCLCIIFYEHRRLWVYLLCGTIASIAGGAVFPLQAFIFSRIFTVFQKPPDELQSSGNFWALIFFILAIGVLLSYGSIGFYFTVAAVHIGKDYRSQYFGAMIKQDVGFFDIDDHSSGAMTSRLSTDPQKVYDLVSLNFGLILIIIVNLVGSCTLAIAVGWKLGLVVIAVCMPVLIFAGFMRMRLEMNSQDQLAKPYRESARFVSEAVGAIRTVSSLTLESKILTTYSDGLNASVIKACKRQLYIMLFFAVSESVDLAANAFAFWWGAKLLSQGEYSTQAFFIAFTAVIFGGQAAGFLFGFTLQMTKGHSAANHIIHLRGTRPPINSSTGATPDLSASSTGDSDSENEDMIVFKDVRFAYPSRPSAPVLRGLDLTIKRGQNVGIVGASGSGKTTIISLLERFYDIDSGSLTVGGTELRELDPHALRACVGLVSQDTTIYQGSIRDNILIGLPDDATTTLISPPCEKTPSAAATADADLDARVTAACKAANIHDFIVSLPAGYATDAGSRGVTLSGGQRQRLALARALVRGPALLLLDEATSALDTQGERLVLDALRTAGRGRTVVSVAHRLSTVRHCDVIFVVDKGRVAEAGSHDDLLLRRPAGRYARMVQGQSLDCEVVA